MIHISYTDDTRAENLCKKFVLKNFGKKARHKLKKLVQVDLQDSYAY